MCEKKKKNLEPEPNSVCSVKEGFLPSLPTV